MSAVAERRRQGVDVYARSGNNTWQSQRGMFPKHMITILHVFTRSKTNILIGNDGNASLAGFNLVTVALEQPTIASSPADGVIPWMSPELLYPDKFGLKSNSPTAKSDLYALGMVVYEVLSGQAPFATYRDPEVVFMVLGGERPERPRGGTGELFTDEIWKLLELCWKERPADRPNLKLVLSALGGEPFTLWPPSSMDGEAGTDTDDEHWAAGIERENDIESRSSIDGTHGTLALPHPKVASKHLCAALGSSIMDAEIVAPNLKRELVRNALKKLFIRSSSSVEKHGDVSSIGSRHRM